MIALLLRLTVVAASVVRPFSRPASAGARSSTRKQPTFVLGLKTATNAGAPLTPSMTLSTMAVFRNVLLRPAWEILTMLAALRTGYYAIGNAGFSSWYYSGCHYESDREAKRLKVSQQTYVHDDVRC